MIINVLRIICIIIISSIAIAMPDSNIQSIIYTTRSNGKIIKKLIEQSLDCCDSKNNSTCNDIIKPDSHEGGLTYQTIVVQLNGGREILPYSLEDKGTEIKVKMLLNSEDGVKNITRTIKFKLPAIWVTPDGKELDILDAGPQFKLNRSPAFSWEKICQTQKLIPEWQKAVDDKKELTAITKPSKVAPAKNGAKP